MFSDSGVILPKGRIPFARSLGTAAPPPPAYQPHVDHPDISITKLHLSDGHVRLVSPRVTRDGRYLMYLDRRNIQCYDLVNNIKEAPIQQPQRCDGEVIAIAIHPSLPVMMVALRDGHVLQWTSSLLGSGTLISLHMLDPHWTINDNVWCAAIIEKPEDQWSAPIFRFRTGPGEQNMHYRDDGSIVAIPGEGWWYIDIDIDLDIVRDSIMHVWINVALMAYW
jgi:hypothetical protein